MACDRTILVPDATAIVQDQDGNELARENIASGATGIIPVNVGGGVLYTYPYDSFNTGQDVSYATGDDKDIRDTVFAPEIAAQEASGLLLVYPRLSQTDPTKLVWGSNPDGSGTNIFGNLERFTDTVGTQIYANDLVIDHYAGNMWYRISLGNLNFIDSINASNNLNVSGQSNFHIPNNFELFKIIVYKYQLGSIGLFPLNLTGLRIGTSTTNKGNNTYYYEYRDTSADNFLNGLIGTSLKGQQGSTFACRKAFTYNTTTKQMELV